jgi:hypothetical protein
MYRTIFLRLEHFTQRPRLRRMNSSRKKIRKMLEPTDNDMSFPVSYSQQAKFLKLADGFLALENSSDDSNVISIDRGTPSDHSKKAA